MKRRGMHGKATKELRFARNSQAQRRVFERSVKACMTSRRWGENTRREHQSIPNRWQLGGSDRREEQCYSEQTATADSDNAADAQCAAMAVEHQIADIVAAVERIFSVNFLQLRSSTSRTQRGWNQRHQMNKSVVGMPGC